MWEGIWGGGRLYETRGNNDATGDIRKSRALLKALASDKTHRLFCSDKGAVYKEIFTG